jgi:hypothetical protein
MHCWKAIEIENSSCNEYSAEAGVFENGNTWKQFYQYNNALGNKKNDIKE